jgi:hypothetical protein
MKSLDRLCEWAVGGGTARGHGSQQRKRMQPIHASVSRRASETGGSFS